MAKAAYIGVNGVARKIKNAYIGVSGKARKIKKVYIGVNGVARDATSAILGRMTDVSEKQTENPGEANA